MGLPPSIDDYIKEAIESTLGLASHPQSVESKLRTYEEIQRHLRNECLFLQSQLKEKDELIFRARAESSMNAQALRKFVDENRKLAAECANLLAQRNKLETECSLYDRDREALMDFGNEAEERARNAEARVNVLEEEVQRLSEELGMQKHEWENHRDDDVAKDRKLEDELLESVITSLIDKGEVASAYAFLEAHSSQESCKELLQMWDSLRPSTQKFLQLAAQVRKLEKDKELCRINLCKAEDEVKLFYGENSMLRAENKRLRRLHYQKERSLSCSCSKSKSSVSAKSNKRKPSSTTNTPVKRIDFSDADSPRQPLSPLKQNSPDLRMH